MESLLQRRRHERNDGALAVALLRSYWALGCALILTPAFLRAENLKDLKPQGYVNDFAGVLSPDARNKLTALCAEVDQKAHFQIAIVTIHTLDGEALEQFSVDLAQKWGVGPKTDRGVLILLVVNDHLYRVEVGYGLEPILPDGKVGGFGRDMRPALRSGNYDAALLQLTGSIAATIAQASGVTLSQSPPRRARSQPNQGFDPGKLVLIAIAFLFFGGLGLFSRLRGGPRGPGGWGWGGPWMGGGLGGFGGGGFGRGGWPGGGFGGGGGGGGFGGFGGGSFGGGGASGSW